MGYIRSIKLKTLKGIVTPFQGLFSVIDFLIRGFSCYGIQPVPRTALCLIQLSFLLFGELLVGYEVVHDTTSVIKASSERGFLIYCNFCISE